MSIDASTPSPSATPGNQPLLSYASRMAAPASESSGSIFRDNEILIALDGSTLPQRCILCGEPPAGAAIRLTFTWDASFTLTRESTLQLRQKAAVHAFLCGPHRTRWYSGRIIGGLGSLFSFTLMGIGLVLAVFSESSEVPAYTSTGIWLTIIGFAGVIFSLFFFAIRTRTLACKLIRENYVYLEGADEAFLQPFPPIPAAAPPAHPTL